MAPFEAPFDLIKNFRIRYKLLIIYSACFLVIISLSSLIVYAIVQQNLEQNIESELKNSTSAILNNVKTAVSVSIKNRLRAVAEKNYDIVQRLYDLAAAGEISVEEAKARAADIVLCQKIGITGYICILDGSGRVLKHPKKPLEGLDISDHRFVQEMIAKKNGYIEYYWKNPEDTLPRPKALYINYFEPWDWLITVSSYRKEFSKLTDTDDFKESILSLRFGRTGYAYVMDTKGNVIIHPELAGINVFSDEGFSHEFFLKMLERKNGKLVYSWKNPGDDALRQKLVIFNFIPEYEWIVASSSYLDELYAPLDTIRRVIIFVGIAALIVFIPITFVLSATITKPLNSLMERFSRDIGSGFSNRALKMESKDEVGQLTLYYNSFMEKLEQYDKTLQTEISERRLAQAALTESEEKYRSVMEAVPDPIVVYDMDGKVTYMNPAFTRVFGYTLADSLGNKMDHFVPQAHWKETMKGIGIILKGELLPRLETKRRAKDGRLVAVATRGSVYRDKNGTPVGSVITHRDISELKHLEKAIMETGERERQAIGNDLHDDLCPHLIGIEGLTKVLKRKVAEQPEQAAMLSDRITELIREAIAMTRRLARGLCPVYYTHGLESSLEEMATNARMLHRVDCSLENPDGVTVDSQMVTLNLHHVAGEAVRNAIRHGKAEKIRVVLESRDGQFSLRIKDNGTGMDTTQKSNGMGLRIMNYRAKIVGASLVISSEPGRGTEVRLTMPVSGLSES